MRRLRKRYVYAVVFAILACFAFLALTFSADNSATWDEPTFISLGNYFLKTGDFSMNTGHPPFAHYMANLPLIFENADLPANASNYTDYSYVAFSHDFLFSQRDASHIVFLSRLSFILLSIILGFFIFKLAKRLYGTGAGILATLLFAFSPLFISYGATALTDLPITAFYFLSVYFFLKYSEQPSGLRLAFVGIFTGLALVSKYTGIFLIPVYIILLAMQRKGPQAIKRPLVFLLLTAVIAFLVIFTVYQFQFVPIKEAVSPHYLNKAYEKLPILEKFSGVIEKVPLPAASFMVGIGQQFLVSSDAIKPSYLLGESYVGNKPQFHIIEFLVKTPIAMFVLLFLAFLAKKNKVVLIPAGLYFLAFMFNSQNMGIHHIMPVYPFLFVFASSAVTLKFNKALFQKAFIAAIAVLSAWYIFASLSIHPNEIAYFNEFVGPDNGYKYFVTSNLDWGQSFKGLQDYVGQQNITSVKLSYFGTVDPYYYGLNFTYLPSPIWQPWVPGYKAAGKGIENCSRTSGIIAISATNLVGAYLDNKSCFSWLEEYKPVAKIGYSIFIYNIT
jgi:4-amino-4-deoxy-L-arabinose transferase-like glycosyltransferase